VLSEFAHQVAEAIQKPRWFDKIYIIDNEQKNTFSESIIVSIPEPQSVQRVYSCVFEQTRDLFSTASSFLS
jgi:hypothetical protein